MPSVNDTIGGKYLIGRLLGTGGMGEVFEATNTNTGRRVAIKTLHGRWAENKDVVQRFLQEARATTRIVHPHVVDVLDLDVDTPSNVPYIVQEFLVGESLQELLAKQPGVPLDPRDALELFIPVMEALVEAHRVGITHRDLKPANIFVTRDRHGAFFPKVIDFGIAKVRIEAEEGVAEQTRTGVTMGTPSYMSPEQAGGDTSLDARSDVWSLGVVLYEVLSRRLPYDAPNPGRMIGMIQYEDPVPLALRMPTIPVPVTALVGAALQRHRDARLPSMQAFLDGAIECLASLPPGPPRVGVASMRSSMRSLTPVPSVPAVSDSVPHSVPGMTGSTMPSVPAWTASTAPPVAAAQPPRRAALFASVAGLLVLAGGVCVWALARGHGADPQAVTPRVATHGSHEPAPSPQTPVTRPVPAPATAIPAAPVTTPTANAPAVVAALPVPPETPTDPSRAASATTHPPRSRHSRHTHLNAATDYP